jgi:histidine triad (HIT) family protein
MSGSSIFTRIINKEIPADIVYEDDLVVAFRDINPQAPIHILIVPREPLVNVSAFSAETEHIAGRMLRAAGEIARQQGIGNGYRLIINEGHDGGQDVMHVHMHLMAGRKLGWPPG